MEFTYTEAKELINEIGRFEESSYDYYGLTVLEVGNNEYAIGTEDEANKASHEYIENSVWAFTANFLASMTEMPYEIFETLQPQCESSNEPILACIERTCGIDEFVEEAISADGRGHFLSGYDGFETDIGDLVMFRIN